MKDRSSDVGTSSATMLPPIDLARQHRLARKLQIKQTANHYFYIDIVGTCNLRCPSCAVGNSVAPIAKGLMSVALYEQILQKITHDYANYPRIFIDLYNWGEPVLHPELAKIIDLTKRHGTGVGISANLNVAPNLRDIVKAEPDYIRISVSGFYNDAYKKTHKGGNIFAVKSNMYHLGELCERYNSQTVVQVGYHVYRSNFPKDFLAMRALCDELGFLFAPVLATLMPAEKALQVAGGNHEGVESALLQNLVLPIDESIALFKRLAPPTQDCQHRQARSTINWDGSVSLCCAIYEKSTISENFLNLDPEELRRRKYDHDFCKTCMGSHINKLYIEYNRDERQEAAVSVLGPIYQQYLTESRLIGDHDHVVVDNAFRNKLDVYHLAMTAVSLGHFDEAETLFGALTDGAPDFGEGFFQASQLAMRRGNLRKALAFCSEAVRLAPSHDVYKQALEQARIAAVATQGTAGSRP